MAHVSKWGTVFVFGATGRIGGAVLRHIERGAYRSVKFDRPAFEACVSVKAARDILVANGLQNHDRVIIAAGQIDPSVDADVVFRVNTAIPEFIAQAAIELGARPITIGTVMENRLSTSARNAYVASKVALANASQGRWLHLQLHTVYGGPPPHRKMFAGQMLQSLISGERFSMTSGLQHREYHHADDEAAAIMTASYLERFSPLELTSGVSVTLAELAKNVFSYFGQEHLLGINDLESPAEEVYDKTISSTQEKFAVYRDPLPSVAIWLQNFLPPRDKTRSRP